MAELRSRSVVDPEEPTLSELYQRALDLRIARIQGQKEFLQIPETVEDKEAAEKKQRSILYQLELDGANIERDFLVSYRSKLINVGGGPVIVGGGGFENACPIACTGCVTPCINCVTNCTLCVGPCPNCVGCTTSVF